MSYYVGRRTTLLSRLCCLTPLLLANLLGGGCAAFAADRAGAYRFPDGRLMAVGQIDEKTWAIAEYSTGASGRLRSRRGGGLEFQPSVGNAPTSAARFEVATHGGTVALWLGDRRGERLPLPEIALRFPAADGAKLTGKLILPTTAGPHPVVVFVHGSGSHAATRTFAYGFFLAAHGVATLVYDKRGTGDSEGKFTFDFDTLAGDVAAAVAQLRTRPEVDAARIGLIGYSQGGWVAPLASSLTPVAFVLVNYGMVESPAEEERQETLWRLRERGLSEAELTEADALVRASLPLLASNFRDGWEAWREAARAARGRAWTHHLEETTIGALLRYPRWLTKWLGPRRAPPHMPWFYDGRAVLEASTTPMVWLLGAQDRSAPNAGTLAILAELERKGKRQAVFLFEEADHGIVLFRRSGSERTATGFHPDYFRTKVRIVRELLAGTWPPSGARTLPARPAEQSQQ
jgi:uncharacterized protein